MPLDSVQEQQLVGGNDTLLHFHLADRIPTHDTVRVAQGVMQQRTVTSSTTATDNDDVILVDSTAGSVTVNLPPSRRGKELILKKIVAANSMILDGNGAETIDGVATITVNTQWAVRRIKAYAGNWIIIGGFL